MKLLLALTVLPMVALSATLSPLPPSEYADTEVSTNIPVVVNFDRMNRLELALSLVPSPSNCVEVAVGADANHDGRLSVEEAAYTFGCDCGRWFLRDAAGDGLEAEAEVWAWDGTPCRVERVFVLKKRKLRTEWNLAKVTRRGSGDAGELVEVRERLFGLLLWVR